MPDRFPSGSTIRRLWPSDRAAVQAYFLRLDPATRADRFMGGVSEAGALAYAHRALSADGVMFGGFVEETLRGLGELRPAGRRAPGFVPGARLGSRAEAAFAVERPYRRGGLGSALFRRVATAARNRGVTDLHLRCLNDNAPMQGFAAKLGADLRRVGPEAEGRLRLGEPTPVSFWQETIAEAFDFSLAMAAAPPVPPILLLQDAATTRSILPPSEEAAAPRL